MLAVRTFSTPHAVNALADIYSALTPEPKIILSPLGLDLKKLFESYPLVFAFLAGLYRGFTFVEVLAWLERKRVRNNVMVPIPGPYGFDPLNPPILANKIDGEVVRIVEKPLTWKGPERNRDRKAAWDALSRLIFDMPAGARRRRAIEIEEICAPFRGDKDFERVRAEAWMVVCDCKANAYDESFILDSRKIEEAAAKFPRERDFSLIRCKFLNILCNWNAQKGIATFEPAFNSAMAICDQFSGDEEFEVERAKVLAMYCRCLVSNDDARCLDVEKQVEAIWSVFYMIEFDFQAALARANTCRFHSRSGNNDECGKAAAAVEEITSRHLYEPAFQLQLAMARAYLCRSKGTSDDLEGAVKEAVFIDGLAAEFASDPFILNRFAIEQALAWCAVAHTAKRMRRDRQHREAVKNIYALDARFPQSTAVRHHADEWRHNRPGDH
jgi:hypothetical protein